METRVIEGTLAEALRQLSALPLEPEARVRITLEEAEQSTTKRARTGITLVPIKDPNRILTTEFVKELLEDS